MAKSSLDVQESAAPNDEQITRSNEQHTARHEGELSKRSSLVGTAPSSEKKEATKESKPSMLKLFILFVSIFFSVFLMALNGSILATVCSKVLIFLCVRS